MGKYDRDKSKIEEIQKKIEDYKNYVLIRNELSFGITKKDPFKQCKFYDKTKTSFEIQE